jgi:hypothetical protein
MRAQMNKYRVKIAYGDPGKHKSNHKYIEVQAESDATAIALAIAKFKNSNSAYLNKEAEAVDVKLLK